MTTQLGTTTVAVPSPSIFSQGAQDTMAGLGFIFTTVGLVITLIVMRDVGRIRKSFMARARLPDVAGDLRSAGSQLSALLDRWPDTQKDVYVCIRVAARHINASIKMLPKETRDDLEAANAKLEQLSKPSLSEDDAWEAYTQIQRCLTDLDQTVKNLKWDQ